MISSEEKSNMPNVLVVDDDPDMLAICSLVLESAGYAIHIAHNGYEAFERIASEKTDVVLMDAMMPVLDGLTVCKMVKRDPRTRNVPVIVMSASSSLRERARECQADAVIPKPFDIDRLLITVNQLASG